MAKKDTIIIERTYNVPLRKEYMKVPRWRRTKKATCALRQFLAKHMKSEQIKISKEVNEELWKHGIKNPPHHVKINVTKDDKGVVKAELFGAGKTTKAVTEKEKKKSTLAEKKETKSTFKKEEAAEGKEATKDKPV